MTAVVDTAGGAVTAPGRPKPVTPLSIAAAELVRLADDPRLPNDVLTSLSAVRDLVAGLDPYLEVSTTPPSPALADLARRSEAHDWNEHRAGGGLPGLEQEMLSGHVEGAFLRMLAAATLARRVLDIGMFTGYSALAVAEVLPAGGRVVACELDPGVAALAQEAFDASPAGSRIDVRVGPAAATLSALVGESFDLVFLDADKAGYTGYVETLLGTGLLARHGLLVVDNTLMQGRPWTAPDATANAAAITAFNAWLAADPRVEQVVVPLRDGITLVRRVDES